MLRFPLATVLSGLTTLEERSCAAICLSSYQHGTAYRINSFSTACYAARLRQLGLETRATRRLANVFKRAVGLLEQALRASLSNVDAFSTVVRSLQDTILQPRSDDWLRVLPHC